MTYVVHAEFCHGPGDEFVESQLTVRVVLREASQRYYCMACGAGTAWREVPLDSVAPKRALLKDRLQMEEIRSF